eukprot:6175865-Pleurochrysis_carterae.AAC.2
MTLASQSWLTNAAQRYLICFKLAHCMRVLLMVPEMPRESSTATEPAAVLIVASSYGAALIGTQRGRPARLACGAWRRCCPLELSLR